LGELQTNSQWISKWAHRTGSLIRDSLIRTIAIPAPDTPVNIIDMCG
jgi:hypothetical protein